jgi:hypothetical protein
LSGDGDPVGFVELDRAEGSIEIGPPGSGSGGLQPTLIFEPSGEPQASKFRMHFGISPPDSDQETELARVVTAGARPVHVGQSGDEGWHVLADPAETSSACCSPRSRTTTQMSGQVLPGMK